MPVSPTTVTQAPWRKSCKHPERHSIYGTTRSARDDYRPVCSGAEVAKDSEKLKFSVRAVRYMSQQQVIRGRQSLIRRDVSPTKR